MDVFLTATCANPGKTFEAQAIVERLERTNPDCPAEDWLRIYIKSEAELRAMMSRLKSRGLPRSQRSGQALGRVDVRPKTANNGS